MQLKTEKNGAEAMTQTSLKTSQSHVPFSHFRRQLWVPVGFALACLLFLAVLSTLVVSAEAHAQPSMQNSGEFNFASYEARTLDAIIDEGRAMEPTESEGIEVIRGTPKLSFDAVLDVQPWACNPTLLYAALNMQRFPVKSLPPINSCIGLRSARGDRVVALIQDTVATFIPKEVQVGDALRVYAMNIYFDNRRKLPVFLVNEFQTKSQPK